MTILQLDPGMWVLAANCRGRTHLFFSPDDSETRSDRKRREAYAKQVCQECAVRAECLAEALNSDERFGIWGGLTERERRAARRARSTERSLEVVERASVAVAPGRSMAPTTDN
jgi:WhiB family transcriptional regulator, redox-sensing transcriptional regulator